MQETLSDVLNVGEKCYRMWLVWVPVTQSEINLESSIINLYLTLEPIIQNVVTVWSKLLECSEYEN